VAHNGQGSTNPDIRIRKDPIKSSNYKKPPSLAIFEESLLKQQPENPKNSVPQMQSAQPGSAGMKGPNQLNLHDTRTMPPSTLTQQLKVTMK